MMKELRENREKGGRGREKRIGENEKGGGKKNEGSNLWDVMEK